jgi:hypothetical protein
LSGKSIAAFMLTIRYPAWQNFRELPGKTVSEQVNSTYSVYTTQIKDIPILISDDVIYLYVGSSANLREGAGNTTVKISWVKNLPQLKKPWTLHRQNV